MTATLHNSGQNLRRIEVKVGDMTYSLTEQLPGQLQIMSVEECHPVAVVPVAPNVIALVRSAR